MRVECGMAEVTARAMAWLQCGKVTVGSGRVIMSSHTVSSDSSSATV
jgi:hypothetical protein